MPKDQPRTVGEVDGDIRDWQAMLKTVIVAGKDTVAISAQLAGLRAELLARRQDQRQARAGK